MTGRRYRWPGGVLIASCLPTLGCAEKLDEALRQCARQTEGTQRLACFDELVGTLPQLEADRFGMTVDIERKRDPAAARQARSQTVSSHIAALRQAEPGQLIFTLDNLQVWAQVQPHSNVHFAIGESVTIEHGAMSSLWLVADGHRQVRVKRIR